MTALSAFRVRPFIPGGKDYELSKRFYAALGFRMVFDSGEVSGWENDGGAFLLQNYFHEGWAHNFMMQLMVHDLDAWWAHIQALDLPGQFGVAPPKPPKPQPWGLIVAYVVGPCGELWHIAQKPA
jgi:hypothetical protein